MSFSTQGQQSSCTFKPPQLTIDFGSGEIEDPNSIDLPFYRRVYGHCPNDGHYSFVSYTFSCFSDDWHTLYMDHSPGDANGNMLLVNAARFPGPFLQMPVAGLKGNTIYEVSLWLLNLCKPTKKCPTVLLPSVSIRLQSPDGKIVANIVTGELQRYEQPLWIKYSATFTTPATETPLSLLLANYNPSGCGNDFALDDISFRECVKNISEPVVVTKTSTAKKPVSTPRSTPKTKTIIPSKNIEPVQKARPGTDSNSNASSIATQPQRRFPPPPLILKNRDNALIKKIVTEAGDIRIDVYDNGEIDGDTVSIYHNNTLIRSRMRLSRKPISFTIEINPTASHHEIIMVAENLGTIPPNTSVMIVTTKQERYEIFISSSEQKNAKVILDLKE